MQSSSSYTVVVYDKNLECHWTARFELLNGNITLDYAIPMPKLSSVTFSKGNWFIYEINTWHVEQICITYLVSQTEINVFNFPIQVIYLLLVEKTAKVTVSLTCIDSLGH